MKRRRMSKRKLLTLMVAIAMMLAALLPSGALAADGLLAGEDTYISVHQYITATDIEDVYKVTVTASGNVPNTFSDLVILCDLSGSMNSYMFPVTSAGRSPALKTAFWNLLDTLIGAKRGRSTWPTSEKVRYAVVPIGAVYNGGTIVGINDYTGSLPPFFTPDYEKVYIYPPGPSAADRPAISIDGEVWFNSMEPMTDVAGPASGPLPPGTFKPELDGPKPLDGMTGGGDTRIYPALEVAAELLYGASATKPKGYTSRDTVNRYVIVMTDGAFDEVRQDSGRTFNYNFDRINSLKNGTVYTAGAPMPPTISGANKQARFEEAQKNGTIVYAVGLGDGVTLEKAYLPGEYEYRSGFNQYLQDLASDRGGVADYTSQPIRPISNPVTDHGDGSKTTSEFYYPVCNVNLSGPGSLSEAFTNIAKSVIPPILARNAVANITLGENVELYHYPGKPLMDASSSDKNILFDIKSGGGSIVWAMNGLTANETGVPNQGTNTLVFYVKFDRKNADGDLWYSIMKDCTFSYTNSEGKSVAKGIPKAYISAVGETKQDANAEALHEVGSTGVVSTTGAEQHQDNRKSTQLISEQPSAFDLAPNIVGLKTVNTTDGKVKVIVEVSNFTNMRFQWQFKNETGTWEDILGANASHYTLGKKFRIGKEYELRCKITNGVRNVFYSDVLTVKPGKANKDEGLQSR